MKLPAIFFKVTDENGVEKEYFEITELFQLIVDFISKYIKIEL